MDDLPQHLEANMTDSDTTTTTGLDVLRDVAEQVAADPTISTHGLGRAIRQLYKEIDLAKAHARGRALLDQFGRPTSAERVQVGGGAQLLDGFLNIDIVPPADLIFDVREGLPLGDASAELIFNEHFLEHIDYPVSAKKFVAECHRVLRPGGRLVIGVPDARMVIEGYVKGDEALRERLLGDWYANREGRDEHFNAYLDLVNYVFRDQDDSDRYTPHLWAYDEERLGELCLEQGFRTVAQWPFDPEIANPDREWGSVYIEAEK
jgi:predicted SAM-dependent methyltransferase